MGTVRMVGLLLGSVGRYDSLSVLKTSCSFRGATASVFELLGVDGRGVRRRSKAWPPHLECLLVVAMQRVFGGKSMAAPRVVACRTCSTPVRAVVSLVVRRETSDGFDVCVGGFKRVGE